MTLPFQIKQEELQRTFVPTIGETLDSIFESRYRRIVSGNDIQDRASAAAPYKSHRSTGSEWLAQHSAIYSMFKRFTFELIEAGHKRFGAKAIAERIRWESKITKALGDAFKIDNTHVTTMARKFVDDFPEYKGVFEFRTKGVR